MKGVFVDLSDKKFGQLTAIKRVYLPDRGKDCRWECVCDCGKVVNVLAANLKKGKTQSCGCTSLIRASAKKTTHGHCPRKNGRPTTTREWRIWSGIKDRCLNSKSKHFHRYGGRGIKLCEGWASSFSQFLSDMGPCPATFTIERVDNNGDYEPLNCIWASRKTQGNNRRTCVYYTVGDVSHSLTEWAELLNIPPYTLRYRLKKGMPFQEIHDLFIGRTDAEGRPQQVL